MLSYEWFKSGDATVLGTADTLVVSPVTEAVVGDYVIVHVGHAIGLLDPEEAEATLALFAGLDGASRAPS